ncbi:alanine-zipper protein [Suttonella indologenes]|uniref:Major outer membrane lipoprotein Lpp n=1 Tax=Suttonella indologenes TaxID=13276 RepID=A0A380ML49_9GAMM|nr:alanine-zipper protein [Suttonella indologenes]SUO92621.1 Uncharacterised protein [Suttonella indologenes]
MKTSMKIAALAAVTVVFAGCASKPEKNADLTALRASVEEARAAAIQANQTSQQALALAQQNAAKIDRVFTKSQVK